MGKVDIEELKKVNQLFMEENDLKALKKLYNLTKDQLIKTILEWFEDEEFKENILEVDTYAGTMYNDLISLIYDKYNLNNI